MSRWLSVFALCVSGVFHAGAQTATGILQGVVTDPTGAGVPGAKVSVENQRTGVVHDRGERNVFGDRRQTGLRDRRRRGA